MERRIMVRRSKWVLFMKACTPSFNRAKASSAIVFLISARLKVSSREKRDQIL